MSRAAPPPSRSTRTRLRRTAWRWRHALAALCLAAAASIVIGELRPEPPPTAPAVVLDASLPAGHVLLPGDLRAVDLPAGSVPAGIVADESLPVGQPLAITLPAGTVLSEGMLARSALASAAGPGEVVVAVRLADDGSASLASPGLRITLLVPPVDGGPAEVVAERVLVLGTVDRQDGGFLSPDEAQVTQIYVSASPEAANVIVGSSAWTPLSVVLGPT